MNAKRILITGGAGFIGSNLVDHLLEEECERVVVVDSFHNFYDPQLKRANVAAHLTSPKYRLVEADICDQEELRKIFASESLDAIVHLAARAGVRPSLLVPHDYFATNVTGTLNLLELAREYQVGKFIFGSSSSVYGTAASAPFQEDAISLPISPYGATKIAAEKLAHTYSHLYDLNVICLRFFTVYGPRQRPDLAIHKFARLISEGKPIPVYGDGTTERDYTYVDDLVSGIIASLNYQDSKFEVINLGESQTVPLHYLIALMGAALGREVTIETLPLQQGDMLKTHADITKARRLLGYQPGTLIETGIRKFIEWYQRPLSLIATSLL